jgi:hypothetical protein
MATPKYDYRIAMGFNVPLGSMTNVETLLSPYQGLYPSAPTSPQLNRYPVRDMTGAGYERGDGRLDHPWNWRVWLRATMDYVVTNWFTVSGVIVVSRPMTIYTPLHDRNGVYVRCNAYGTLFVPDDDGAFRLKRFDDPQLRFTKLIPLA